MRVDATTQHELRDVAPRVRGARSLRYADAGGAPRVPGAGAEAPGGAGAPAAGAGRPRHVGSGRGHRVNRELILGALPGDCHHVGAETGLGKTTIWRWLTDLHVAGETHIVKWSRVDHGGPYIPTYAPGPGTDVPCKIKPMTEKQKSRRFRAKARKNGRWEDIKAANRARAWADRAEKNRDPLVAALFGPATRKVVNVP